MLEIFAMFVIGFFIHALSKDVKNNPNSDNNSSVSNNSGRYRTVGKGWGKKIYDKKTRTYIVS